MRGRFSRYSERASYKTSEVLALFLLGIFTGFLFFGTCALLDYVFRNLLGLGRS